MPLGNFEQYMWEETEREPQSDSHNSTSTAPIPFEQKARCNYARDQIAIRIRVGAQSIMIVMSLPSEVIYAESSISLKNKNKKGGKNQKPLFFYKKSPVLQ